MALATSPGCSGFTVGPTIERRAIVVRAGTAIEVLEDVTVRARLLAPEDGESEEFEQGVGGWIMMHPDHWQSLKAEVQRLRTKAGEIPPEEVR